MNRETDVNVIIFWLILGILGGFALGVSFYHSVSSYPTRYAVHSGYARYNEENNKNEWIPIKELKSD